MAATKKPANTSKTAHVMNLLSKNRDTAPADAEAVSTENVSSTGSTPAVPPQTPPVLSSMSSDAEVSAQIKSALEDNLENEVAAVPEPVADIVEPEVEIIPEPVTEPVPEPPAAAEPEPASLAASPAEPDSAPDYQEAESVAVEEPAPIPEPEFTCVNVMQVLVEEYTAKYVKMFGVCDCDRCVADIKALALNNLPPKYVIMDRGDIIPKLTFYEGKFNSDVTAQVLQACKTVMNRPHHNR